jgi:hypothetical protein
MPRLFFNRGDQEEPNERGSENEFDSRAAA